MKKSHGFSMIETMIVVAIIAVLGTIAIPQFVRYTKLAKTSEATISMMAIAKGATAWWNEAHPDTNGDPISRHFPHALSPHQLPPVSPSSSKTTTPSGLPCAGSSGSMFKKQSAQWQQEPWLSLRFGIYNAHYFQYATETSNSENNATFTIMAHADLDCDNIRSTFELRMEIDSNGKEVLLLPIVSGDALE